ncbi:hypothetical protein AVEN_144601-1 [Araneus ventricosus]|uniref:Uncharacterized protein n=1 Tax=Araneus ventricosus TaxID=182803 RepID=A0A4Y2BYL7_ARAVE|nr:hypothetical protein AVEN_144601-1 [Araneus ventricosus]
MPDPVFRIAIPSPNLTFVECDHQFGCRDVISSIVAQSRPYIATEKKTPLRSHGNTLVRTKATCLEMLPMVQSVDESSVMKGKYRNYQSPDKNSMKRWYGQLGVKVSLTRSTTSSETNGRPGLFL